MDISKYEVDGALVEIETKSSLTLPEKQKQLYLVNQMRKDISDKKRNILICIGITTSVFLITSIIYYKKKGYFIVK